MLELRIQENWLCLVKKMFLCAELITCIHLFILLNRSFKLHQGWEMKWRVVGLQSSVARHIFVLFFLQFSKESSPVGVGTTQNGIFLFVRNPELLAPLCLPVWALPPLKRLLQRLPYLICQKTFYAASSSLRTSRKSLPANFIIHLPLKRINISTSSCSILNHRGRQIFLFANRAGKQECVCS